QFENESNFRAHFLGTGKEIIEQTKGKVDGVSRSFYQYLPSFFMSALSLLRLVETLNVNRFVLASKSPRRLELLKTVTGGRLDVEVVGSTFPEDLDKSALSPAEYVLQTATEKSKEVISRLEPPPSGRFTMVLSADTVVVLDGKILEKPDDHSHAMAMLRALRGKTHEVSTGVCVVCEWADGRSMKRQFTTTTRVTFAANITDEDLQAYVDTEEPMGKAGSYGIQLSSSNKRRRERLEADLLSKAGEDFGLRDGPYTIECTNEIGSSWRVKDRGDIVLRKTGTQWNLYIHELDASSSSLAVATPARVPSGTTCLVMLEPAEQPGGVSRGFLATLFSRRELDRPVFPLRQSWQRGSVLNNASPSLSLP
ncbi:hypothetical protein FOZ63_026735, partial [Perkinsus olseni]